jgi:lipoyl(octanoyl) transferase
MAENCDVCWLGLVEYEIAWQMQISLAAEIAAGRRPPTLLLLEHPHTYTIGPRGNPANLLWDPAECSRKNISIYHVDRGGDITYHGPGQLVGYPLFPLKKPGAVPESGVVIDSVGYIRNLEKALIFTLARFGLVAGTRKGLTGVWIPADVRARCLRCDPAEKTDPAKIASIGVRVDAHGITRHGFALNVIPNMNYWQGIVPCGIGGVVMTSMAELLDPCPSMMDVMVQTVQVFEEVFSYEMQWVK